MTVLTDTQVVTASGGLVELGYSQITSAVSVTSAVFPAATEVIAPLTVVCDGGPVLIEFFAPSIRPNNTSGDEIWLSLFMDGSESIRQWAYATTPAANWTYFPTRLAVRLTPSAGSHTFGVKSRVTNAARAGSIDAGTGASTTSAPAFLRVSKIVTATQWPAVTTGTIIATSSTRPASPFAGQKIYQTDNSKEFVYNGSAWVQTYPPNIVQATKTAQQTVTSTSLTDITDLSVSITPSASTSKVLVSVAVQAGAATSNVGFMQLLRDSTQIAKGTGATNNYTFLVYPSVNPPLNTFTLSYLDSPATASAVTYKMQAVAVSGSTIYINRPGVDSETAAISTVTAQEIPV